MTSPPVLSRSGFGPLFVVVVALFFGVLNGSAVAVVLPAIGDDLDIATADLSWVLSGFLLTYGVAIPFYGRLADRFGAKRLFLGGVSLFVLGSLLSAAATGLPTLLAARTVQAAGGAAVPGLGMTLASNAYPEHRRGVVLGIVAATMGVGTAAGPLAAGVVTELADWRMLFVVSAAAAISVPLGARLLPDDEAQTHGPLDLAGGALFGGGVVASLFAVTNGSQHGWTDPVTVAAVIAGATVLLAFSAQQRSSTVPFIPTALLGNRPYLALTLLGFLISFADLAVQIGLPFAFTELHRLSTLAIGVALVPAAVATAVAGVLAGRITDSVGGAPPIRIGSVVMLLGVAAASSTVGSGSVTLAALTVVLGIGFALVHTPLTATVSLLVRPEHLATALSLNTMMFFIGGSFGAAIFTSTVERTGAGAAWNPLHAGVGADFSNGFAVLLLPLLLALLVGRFTRRDRTADGDPHDQITHHPTTTTVGAHDA